MALTPAQLVSLKADIIAAADAECAALEADPTNADLAFAVASLYNLLASPNFWGNYASVPANDIFDAVAWKKYYQVDVMPVSPQLDVVVYNARANICWMMADTVRGSLIGRTAINATKGKIRTMFQESLEAVPSGAAGVTRDAGWTDVQKILCRKGTRLEKLLADTASGNGGSNTTAATFVFEGTISHTEVLLAMATA